MADTPVVPIDSKAAIAAAEALQKSTDDSVNSLTAYIDVIKQAAPALDYLTNKTKEAGNIIKEATEYYKNYESSIKLSSSSNNTFKDTLVNMSPVIGQAIIGVFGLSKSFDSFDQKSAMGVSSIKSFSDSMEEAQKKILNMTASVKSLFPALGLLTGPLEGVVKIFGKLEKENSKVKQLETNFTALRSQFAGFKDQEDKMTFIGNIDDEMSRLTTLHTSVADGLNVATSEVNSYAESLYQIPGAYKQMVNIGGTNMDLLTAASKTARGTTMNFSDSVQSLTYQWENFGATNNTGLEILSKTYAVSQSLGVRFKDLEGPVREISDGFKVFGDNTGASVNLVGKLGTALQSTGLGIIPTISIIKNVTNAMANLTLAQKSFLSSQSGGSGGLRGGYEIDLLMQQGKMDEVYNKMKNVLMKQFGGKIVSTEEAAGSDQAAGQMAKQEAFLMQGPFGSLVKTQAEAQKLLSAFSKGDKVDTKPIDQSLQTANEVSDKWQEKQFNVAQSSLNQLENIGIQTAISATAATRLGVGGDNEVLKRVGYNERVNSIEDAAQKRLQIKDGTNAESSSSALKNAVGEFANQMAGNDSVFNNIIDATKQRVGDLRAKVSRDAQENKITSDRKKEEESKNIYGEMITGKGTKAFDKEQKLPKQEVIVTITLQDQNKKPIPGAVVESKVSESVASATTGFNVGN